MKIPSNLEECLEELKKILSFEDQTFLIQTDNPVKLHHTLGRWIRNNWLLWQEDSSLHQWFKTTYGLFHADDMSGVILESFWHHLRNEPHDIDAQVQKYKEYWKNQNEQQITS
jgi:hypothetical protein